MNLLQRLKNFTPRRPHWEHGEIRSAQSVADTWFSFEGLKQLIGSYRQIQNFRVSLKGGPKIFMSFLEDPSLTVVTVPHNHIFGYAARCIWLTQLILFSINDGHVFYPKNNGDIQNGFISKGLETVLLTWLAIRSSNPNMPHFSSVYYFLLICMSSLWVFVPFA